MKDKVRTTDLSKKELPKNRKEVFVDLLKHQKRDLVSLSMLTFVFLLPLVVDILVFNQYIIGAGMSIEDKAVLSSTVFSLIFYMMLIAIPCVLIAFVGLGALAHVCKNIVWQEGVIIGPDFFSGLKKNWKHSLIIGLIFGLSLFLLVVGTLFFERVEQVSEMPWVLSMGVGLCIVQFIVLSIVCVYALTYTCYYTNSIRDVLRNSFVFLAAKFFKNILLFSLTTGLVVGLMFADFIAQIIIIVLLAFIISFMMIGWTLLSHEAFDQYINMEFFPDYYKKGLYIDSPKEE